MLHTAGATDNVTSMLKIKTHGHKAMKSSDAASIGFVNKFLESNTFSLVITARNKTKASPQQRTFLQTQGCSSVSELTQ